MTAEEIADEFIGLIPTPNGSWDEIKQELAEKIEAYALSKQQVNSVDLDDVVKSLPSEPGPRSQKKCFMCGKTDCRCHDKW
jgi:hypothetical protein